LEDDELEWKLRAFAPPIAIVVAIAFHAWPTGHWLQRTFLSMIVHELGHAVTAWWCGFGALPGLWKTMVPEARSTVVPILLAAANAGVIWLGWRTGRRAAIAIGVALLALQALGTLATSPWRAQQLIIFGGDGGAIVLGALLMMTFFVPPDHRLATTHVRWGLLAIGAAAYVDSFATWIARDIPFGEIEGVGLSDPSKLVETYDWAPNTMVARYQQLGAACGLALAVAWFFAVRAARATATSSGRTDRASPT
jgi:hypothetical protein